MRKKDGKNIFGLGVATPIKLLVITLGPDFIYQLKNFQCFLYNTNICANFCEKNIKITSNENALFVFVFWALLVMKHVTSRTCNFWRTLILLRCTFELPKKYLYSFILFSSKNVKVSLIFSMISEANY